MGKTLWSKLKFLLANEGSIQSSRHEKEEDMDSLMSKSDVNEEYKQAFRTKSYIEIYDKVQHHLVRVTCADEGQSSAASSASPPPPLPPSSSLSSSPSPPPIQISHLSEYLLEPHQQPLETTISSTSSNFRGYLVNYFEISLEACRICESLLTSIHQVRNNHRKMKKLIKLIKRLPENGSWTKDQYHVLHKNLASFASQRNPFSTMNPQKFQELHETHVILFQELTSKCMKIKRRTKIVKLIKRAIASFLVIGCSALAIVLLVLVMHCMVGLVAAPGLVMWSLMVKKVKRKCNDEWLEGLVAKLDIAARGVYTMINDFDTMSQVVKMLHDELERRKYLADVCVRRGKNEIMLKEVVREFQMHESCFLEELEELEKLIYLCFLDINRSRRLLCKRDG